ncbi:hypothetical protein HGH93_15185 [Chitinophaga polysaccharea]|uniref:hypothetical protein n=1 Tax=Chitinophaga polysaccharea TaxID=1293035 RepID=UPI0014550E41|nr:hypothetical protein [Chitinophaga polysaccharea]NLR59459.1 hypothetical protein [Chitinophaga polysaccharea]
MSNYKYFTQEGNKFHLKSSMSTAVARTVVCLAIGVAVYIIIPPEKKIGIWAALLFLLLGLINLLKTTKKLTIDPNAKTIAHKNNALNNEVVYHFNEFENFYVLNTKYLFITLDSTAFFIFTHNGNERRVPIVVGLFNKQSAQNAINEVSEIMGIEAN